MFIDRKISTWTDHRRERRRKEEIHGHKIRGTVTSQLVTQIREGQVFIVSSFSFDKFQVHHSSIRSELRHARTLPSTIWTQLSTSALLPTQRSLDAFYSFWREFSIGRM